MKCEYCKYAPPVGAEGEQDECGYYEKFGTVWKDGEYGCTLHPKTLEKYDRKYTEYLGRMGTEMGIEMDFEMKHLDLEKTIEHCKHMIGLDRSSRIYHRHGKAFYKAYRNYWYGKPREDFDCLCCKYCAFMERKEARDGMVYYYLTKDGMEWLSRKLKVIIKEED